MKLKILESQNDFDKAFSVVKSFCRSAVKDADNTIERQNMDFLLWRDNPASFMYKLYVKKSFMMLTFLYDIDIIGISGVEHFDKDMALIGRRLFILKEHRGQQVFMKYMLDAQLEFIKKRGYSKGLMTVNEYNKRIYDLIKRISQGSAVCLGGQKRIKINMLEKPFELNNVKQYGFYIEV